MTIKEFESIYPGKEIDLEINGEIKRVEITNTYIDHHKGIVTYVHHHTGGGVVFGGLDVCDYSDCYNNTDCPDDTTISKILNIFYDIIDKSYTIDEKKMILNTIKERWH